MKRFVLPLATIVSILAIVSLAQSAEVTVPQDNKPFTVGQDAIVRLQAHGIAGSKIVADITGPATSTENNIIHAKDGKILIGTTITEFDIKPTDKGKVTVKITVTPPQPNAKSTVKVHEFEVK